MQHKDLSPPYPTSLQVAFANKQMRVAQNPQGLDPEAASSQYTGQARELSVLDSIPESNYCTCGVSFRLWKGGFNPRLFDVGTDSLRA